MRRFCFGLICCSLTVLSLAGCGGTQDGRQSEMFPVKGTVTGRDGQLLTGRWVALLPIRNVPVAHTRVIQSYASRSLQPRVQGQARDGAPAGGCRRRPLPPMGADQSARPGAVATSYTVVR